MENLFSGFSSLSLEEWKKQIEKSLKGTTYDQLSQKDENGILIHPVYNSENSIKNSSPLFFHHDWNICSEINPADEKTANAVALEELSGGADSLNFILEKNCSAEILLKEILIEHIRTNFSFKSSPKEFISQVEKVISERNLDGKTLNGFFCFDSLYENPTEKTLNEWKTFVSSEIFQTTNYTPFCFDVSQYHNLGANSVTELSCFVLQLNEYLNFCEENNPDSYQEGNKEIVIIVSVGNNFFESVAKLRALRKLFNLLTKQYGIKNPLYLHCKNSLINKSTLDIHTNLLRATTEGMAAVIGGANSLTIFPYNNAIKENDPQALRFARNQQIIFKEEAALNKVADIAAGSYYIETLSNRLAENAWEIFKAIENEGGFISCMQNGFIPELISAFAEKQKQDFNSGKKVLVGVNKFRNEKEKVFQRLKETIAEKNLILGREIELSTNPIEQTLNKH